MMATKSAPKSTGPRLKREYKEKYAGELKSELGLSNVHQVPNLDKIVLSCGIGKHKDDKRFHEIVVNTLRKISGQQPIDRMARKSIATFKIRKGMNRVGVSVTLRGRHMYEFLDRFVNVVLPRVRDFHGVKGGSFDPTGNFNLGIQDQSVFPELTFEDTAVLHGLQITIVIKSQEKSHSRALLEKFGLPFEKENK